MTGIAGMRILMRGGRTLRMHRVKFSTRVEGRRKFDDAEKLQSNRKLRSTYDHVNSRAQYEEGMEIGVWLRKAEQEMTQEGIPSSLKTIRTPTILHAVRPRVAYVCLLFLFLGISLYNVWIKDRQLKQGAHTRQDYGGVFLEDTADLGSEITWENLALEELLVDEQEKNE